VPVPRRPSLTLPKLFLFTALGDLVSEEVRGWLDLAPRMILRLAAARIDPESRDSIYRDVWLPDLFYLLRGDESRPITRLFRGMTFAVGLLFSARKVQEAASGMNRQTGGIVSASTGSGTGRVVSGEVIQGRGYRLTTVKAVGFTGVQVHPGPDVGCPHFP
jgi:hypothetical protein